MMPGGDSRAYDRIAPFLQWRLWPTEVPCCAYIGPDGAGHYVKMVHNGIEYADMQLIAEAYDILKSVYGLSAARNRRRICGWSPSRLIRTLSRSPPGARQDRRIRLAAGRQHPRRGRAEGHGGWTAHRRSNSACRSRRSRRRFSRAPCRASANCGSWRRSTPDDAARLTMASTEGKIQLALRNTVDTRLTAPAAVLQDTLFAGAPPPPKPSTVVKYVPPAPSPYVVEVITGSKRENKSFPNP